MSKHVIIDGQPVFAIKKEDPNKCEECGALAELRPYGKNGANVCFMCMMKDEENAKKQFAMRVLGPVSEVKS